MSLEEAFLADVRANPDDDTPRLVYADWLDEHGGAAGAARAELIRVQCALARPGGEGEWRRGLEAREERLLREHGPGWREPLADLRVSWDDAPFTRGFVEAVEMAAPDFLQYAGELFRVAPLLRRLTLWNADTHAVEEGLADCAYLERLTSLRFDGRSIVSHFFVLRLVRSRHLRHLAHLDLSCNDIGDEGARHIAQSPHLGRLTRLGLAYSALTAAGVRALTTSPYLTGLTELDLSGNHAVGATGAELVAASDRLAGLTTLRLSLCGLDADAMRALVTSPRLARLTRLDLDGNSLRDDGLVGLADGPYPARLETLSLHNVQSRRRGAEALAGAPKLSGLTRLYLHGRNSIGSGGIRALADSPHLGRLRELYLDIDSLDVPAAQALAGSRTLEGLDRLHFSSVRVGVRPEPQTKTILKERFGARVSAPW
jgi:uncharacterized protein (TIGR02996 family)